MIVNSTPRGVSIMDHREDGLRAAASADFIGPYWWISRIIIDPPDRRRKGLGTAMLKALIAEVIKQGGTEIWVSPGGYGSDPAGLFRFYERQDFVRENDDGLFIWRSPV